MTLEIVLAISIVALFFSLCGFLSASLKLKKMQQRIDKVEQAFKQVKNERNNIQKQLAELHSGAVGLGNKFVNLELSIDELKVQQQQVGDFDPDSKLYSRAVKMVELGAGLEEVMAECEIPRAEAELLLSLHRQ